MALQKKRPDPREAHVDQHTAVVWLTSADTPSLIPHGASSLVLITVNPADDLRHFIFL